MPIRRHRSRRYLIMNRLAAPRFPHQARRITAPSGFSTDRALVPPFRIRDSSHDRALASQAV